MGSAAAAGCVRGHAPRSTARSSRRALPRPCSLLGCSHLQTVLHVRSQHGAEYGKERTCTWGEPAASQPRSSSSRRVLDENSPRLLGLHQPGLELGIPLGCQQSMGVLILRQKRGPAAWSAPKSLPGASIQGVIKKQMLKRLSLTVLVPVCLNLSAYLHTPLTKSLKPGKTPISQCQWLRNCLKEPQPSLGIQEDTGVPAATSPCCPQH